MITIEVRGIPAPQGSKTRLAHGAMVESGRKKLDPWREAVRSAAERVLGGTHSRFMDRLIPVAMDIQFRVPRPASLPRKIRLPVKRPDMDKLERAIHDALVDASVMASDSQVTLVTKTKRFASDLAPAGVTIQIDEDIDYED